MQLIKHSSLHTTKGMIIPQVGMIINIYYNDIALLQVLNGGPTKTSWLSFRQIHCFGLSSPSELQSDYPW
jgi:hypothetical protein